MSARFAGSKSLDERRRRRLAVGADDPSEYATPVLWTAPRSRGGIDQEDESMTNALPLGNLIAHRPWKHWMLGLLALLVAAGLLAAGWQVVERGTTLGPGFVRLFDLSVGRAADAYSVLLLALSGQLALLIWYVRSRSPGDFDGQYQVWLWGAAAAFLFAAAVLTGAHRALAETLVWLWCVDLGAKDALCWLAPAAGCGGTLLQALSRDVRDCRSSLTLLWLAGLGWLTAGLLTLDFSLPITDLHHRLLATGSGLFGHVCLFTGLLLHARHVIHETPEPPALRPSRLRQWMARFRLPAWRLRLWKSHEPAAALETTTKADDEHAAERETAASSPAQKSRQTSKPAAKRKPAAKPKTSRKSSRPTAAEETIEERQDESESEEFAPAADVEPDVSEAAGGDLSSDDTSQAADGGPSDTTWRIDDPTDKDQLKGLSKRERRKLQKQMREQQRTGRRG